jgi:hypothetical protein
MVDPGGGRGGALAMYTKNPDEKKAYRFER